MLEGRSRRWRRLQHTGTTGSGTGNLVAESSKDADDADDAERQEKVEEREERC